MTTILIFVAIAVLLLLLLIPAFVHFLNDFNQELRVINTEIGRSMGEEKKHWLRRRRRLWLSLIPFIRY